MNEDNLAAENNYINSLETTKKKMNSETTYKVHSVFNRINTRN